MILDDPKKTPEKKKALQKICITTSINEVMSFKDYDSILSYKTEEKI
jgi:hypothetical protein